MKKTSNISNAEIYSISNALNQAFNDSDIYIPAKTNFFIQKNRSYFNMLKEDIERVRLETLQRFGSYNEETQSFSFSKSNQLIVNKELNDLLSIIQSVEYYMISLSELEGLKFTARQMQAILFMIEEEE